jgi:NAD(P)H dehydrogenase (quinone)
VSTPKIAVVFYSTYGTNHAVAQAAASAAEAAGAEVRLRRVPETAPAEVVNAQDAWREQLERMKDIPEASLDDLDWADGYFVSVPTRYGLPPSQFTAFTDTTGGLWQRGALANKTFTATTSAQNDHGGQEGTILSLYHMAIHWGAIIVAPGYNDPVKFTDGGNPYGFSTNAGAFDDAGKAAVAHQAKRLVEMTARIAG